MSEASAKVRSQRLGLRHRVQTELGLQCKLEGPKARIRGILRPIEEWESQEIKPYDPNDASDAQWRYNPAAFIHFCSLLLLTIASSLKP